MALIVRTLIVGAARTGPQGPQGEAGGDNITATAPLVRTVDALSIPAATASVNGYATAAQITKLDGIEALADVTDAANVAAAGAVMTTRTITTTAPLTIDGGASASLAANRTLAISAATVSAAGSQSAADKALWDAEHTVRAVSGTTATLAATDGFLDVTTTAGAYTVTGPGGTGVRCWVIAKVTTDANAITLARAGSETINGAASNLVLPDSDSTELPSWTVRRDGSGNLRVL